MTEKKILVISEGKHELGGELEKPLSGDNLPALPCIVNRLLGSPANVKFVCRSHKKVGHAYGKGEKWAKKIKGALLEAKEEKYAVVVFVIDRDGKSHKSLPLLANGRDELSNNPSYPPCAVGVAVEAFDAWMISDPNAIEQAGGDKREASSTPESLRQPKEKADEIFGTKGGKGLGAKYQIVAQRVNLEKLKQICPQGFAPFAQDVKDNLP